MNFEEPIVARDLNKQYSPDTFALRDLDLTVFEGETIGILGNNGAGKTTLLRILATLLRHSAGMLEIFGLSPVDKSTKIKQYLGYLPERFSFYPGFTVEQIIEYFIHLQQETNTNLEKTDLYEQKEKISKLLELHTYMDKNIGSLSKGMLHKVGLGVTLIHDPKLLLLDEPTSGLDPLVRLKIRKVLQELTQDLETTVLISSHILEDVEATSDRILFLENGKVLHGDLFWMSQLREKFQDLRRLEVQGMDESNGPKIQDLQAQDGVLYIHPQLSRMDIYCHINQTDQLRHTIQSSLSANSEQQLDIKNHAISLEDIYLLNAINVDWIDF